MGHTTKQRKKKLVFGGKSLIKMIKENSYLWLL